MQYSNSYLPEIIFVFFFFFKQYVKEFQRVADSLTKEDKDDVTMGLYFFDFIFIQIVCRPSFKTIEHEIIQSWSRRVFYGQLGTLLTLYAPPKFFFIIAAEEVQSSRIILPGALCIIFLKKCANSFIFPLYIKQ